MFSILLSAVALAAASPAVGTAQPAPAAARIHIADLDLSSAAGVKTFDQRIHRAAEIICPSDGVVELARKIDLVACRQAFLATASVQRDDAIARAAARRVTLALNGVLPVRK